MKTSKDIGLKVQFRKNVGKGSARKIRREGFIPAILYGKENVAVSINPTELKKALIAGGGINTLLHLDIDGTKKTAIVKEIQKDPLRKQYLHVDFHELDLTKKMTVSVPLHFVGKAEGLKEGGILQPIIREVKVKCLPNNIPSHIEVDVSALKIGDSLRISDVKTTQDYDILYEQDDAIASVAIPKEEVAPVPAVTEAEAAPTEVAAPGATGAKEVEAKVEEGKGKEKETPKKPAHREEEKK